MPVPNLFIVYVSDIPTSTAFYGRVFEMEPRFSTPRFVEFDLATGVGLALWAGDQSALATATSRTGEVCLDLPGGAEQSEREYQRWCDLGVEIVKEPHDDVFGRMFVARDPDGNLLRVAPVDV